MKTILLAGLCSTTLLISTASAESYVRESDPSGAAQCFTKSGEKASLSHCDDADSAPAPTLVRDPSGAPMCRAESGELAPLSACDESLASAIEPNLLESLPDDNAASVAAKFVAAVENGSSKSFASLIHPRGIHHGRKKIRKSAITKVVRTLGVRSFVSMPDGQRWNVRSAGSWFSVFRGEGAGNTSIAYFELYRGKWRLVQLARVSFAKTASR